MNQSVTINKFLFLNAGVIETSGRKQGAGKGRKVTSQLMAQARRVKGAHVESLLAKRNVVGVGLGYKISQGINTGELALVVSVTRKATSDVLSTKDMVPKSLDGVKTDVVATGGGPSSLLVSR